MRAWLGIKREITAQMRRVRGSSDSVNHRRDRDTDAKIDGSRGGGCA